MNSEAKIVLGLDIGGTAIKSLALDASHRILEEREVRSHASDIGPEGVKKAIEAVAEHYREKGIAFQAVGIGCAGAITPETGVVRNSPNFAHWKDVPLKEWAEKNLGCPVSIDNDANCALMAEWKMGEARGSRNVVLLTLGTGVGGGLVLDGKLFKGATGTASEIGHLSLYADGIPCNCGNLGCFERYCSASALQAKINGHTAKEIFELAAQEKAPFRETIEKFFSDLKVGITSLTNVFNPDYIILGGAVSRSVYPRMDELRSWLKEHAFAGSGEHVKLVPTRHGNQSGALGAALLAL